MTINNPDLYVAGIWDWGILDGCFGNTMIRPTDIDGMVERNGRVLVIETKAPDASIPTGQQIMFDRLSRMGIAVLIVWGETNTPQKARLILDGEIRDYDPCPVDKFRRIVSRWYVWADKNPSPFCLTPL